MFSESKIKELLEKGLTGSQVAVIDYAGDQDHFEISIVYEGFKGKGLLERHRIVYAALGAEAVSQIHAMKLKTQTVEEYKNES